MTNATAPPVRRRHRPRPFDPALRRVADLAWADPFRFDATMATLGAVVTAGVVADGWSHIRFGADQTVFSPYHLTFYSGAISVLVLLTAVAAARLRAATPLSAIVPTGYRGALAGAAVFLLSGAVDLAGHAAFGFETGLEIVVSPTHLALFACWVGVVSGPAMAGTRRLGAAVPSLAASVPVLVSAGCTAAALTVAISPLAALSGLPVADSAAVTEIPALGQGLGLARILIQTTVLVGVLAWLRRRIVLPAGAATVYLGVFGAAVSGLRQEWWLIGLCLVAGATWDAAAWLASRTLAGPRAGAVALLASPGLLWALYFAKVALVDGDLEWSFYLWSGAIAQSIGIGGLLHLLSAPATASQGDIGRSRQETGLAS